MSNKDDRQKMISAVIKRLKQYQSAQFLTGEDLHAMGDWPVKPHFERCLEMWFWAYWDDNKIYRDMMTVSPLPFWTKGQAQLDLTVRIRHLAQKVKKLSGVEEAERQMSIVSRELEEAKEIYRLAVIDI